MLATAFTDRRLVLRLLVAALLLTANWTSYVWAVSNDHVIEAALGLLHGPAGDDAARRHRAPRAGRRRCSSAPWRLAALAVVVLTFSYGRPPIVAVVIAASWSLYALLKRQIPLTAIESLAGETFLLTVPAAVVAVVMAGHGGSIPGSATGREWALVALTGVVTAVPAAAVLVRRPAGPVHAARRAAVPRPDDQPGARLVHLRRVDAGRPDRRLRPGVGGARPP